MAAEGSCVGLTGLMMPGSSCVFGVPCVPSIAVICTGDAVAATWIISRAGSIVVIMGLVWSSMSTSSTVSSPDDDPDMRFGRPSSSLLEFVVICCSLIDW